MTFVEKATEFTSTITVRRVDADDTVDGKSIMQMLMLAGTRRLVGRRRRLGRQVARVARARALAGAGGMRTVTRGLLCFSWGRTRYLTLDPKPTNPQTLNHDTLNPYTLNPKTLLCLCLGGEEAFVPRA